MISLLIGGIFVVGGNNVYADDGGTLGSGGGRTGYFGSGHRDGDGGGGTIGSGTRSGDNGWLGSGGNTAEDGGYLGSGNRTAEIYLDSIWEFLF